MYIFQHSPSLEMGLINDLGYSVTYYNQETLKDSSTNKQKFAQLPFNNPVLHKQATMENAAVLHKVVCGNQMNALVLLFQFSGCGLACMVEAGPGLSHSQHREARSKEAGGKQFFRRHAVCREAQTFCTFHWQKTWAQVVKRQDGEMWFFWLYWTHTLLKLARGRVQLLKGRRAQTSGDS